jgi:hypothetical protein
MKNLLPFLFSTLIFLSSCGDANPRVRKNEDGTINFKVYTFGDKDSMVNYFYFKNQKPKQINIGINKNGKTVYNYECRYDSVTGKLTQEYYFDSTGNILRGWSQEPYDEYPNKPVTREIFGRLRDGRQCALTFIHDDKPVKIIYTAYNDPESKLQRYDEEGKIEKVSLLYIGQKDDTLLKYDTPELKAAFHDTLMEMMNEMRKRIVFPTTLNK